MEPSKEASWHFFLVRTILIGPVEKKNLLQNTTTITDTQRTAAATRIRTTAEAATTRTAVATFTTTFPSEVEEVDAHRFR